MNQLNGTLYYYGVNMRHALIIFWGIMVGILVLSLVGDLLFSEEANIYFAFSIPIYIFAGIMGFWVVKNIIPYLVKMGITRLSIYIGTGVAFILLVVLNATISNTLNTVMTDVIGSNITSSFVVTMNGGNIAGSGSLLELFAKDTWGNRFVIDVSIQFICIAISFLFGLIFYRYKLVGGAMTLGAVSIGFIYSVTSGWLLNVVVDLWNDFSMVFFYQLFLAGLVIYLLSHLLLRKLTA